ncbi:hypothetical protein [Alicyclobacillus mengziensis]|uniref:Uncharacterized protein n=1 Tax=Alicyclobacillus mengziensis TaxID=2931921 RepID=A0A9X7W471_9BACL|nr:hypothetical protein [Alicyclobacillus mengziensis]QSO49178.1 hypothetical protein JZ786_09795 [Alicyclobacillus mengziensis]
MEKRKRGRPPKLESKKTGELIAYLPEGVLTDFKAAAEQRSVSMSTLAGQLITDFLYGKEVPSLSAQGIALEVVRLLGQQDALGNTMIPMQNEIMSNDCVNNHPGSADTNTVRSTEITSNRVGTVQTSDARLKPANQPAKLRAVIRSTQGGDDS